MALNQLQRAFHPHGAVEVLAHTPRGAQSRHQSERHYRGRELPVSWLLRLPAKPALHAAICAAVLGAPLLSGPASKAQAPERWSTAPAVSSRAEHQNSVMRPGALDDIPHLTEIIWDEMDLPSLMAVRYLPQKMSFAPGWTEWVEQTIFRQDGLMTNEPPSPWPPFFVVNERPGRSGIGISPEDMARFQNWCQKRAEALPPVIVHSIPYLPPANPQKIVRILPFGIQPGEAPENQRIEGIGFTQIIYLGLARNADDYAVELPADVVARLPRSGLRLETRTHWSDPEQREGTLFFATEPLSLRLVAGKELFWEHRYDAGGPAPGQQPQASPAQPPPPDIKF